MLNQNLKVSFLFNVFKHCNCPCTTCTSAANAISREVRIFNGRSFLINDLLHMSIFTKKKIISLNRFYAVVHSLAVYVNCTFNLVTLFVIKLITFCTDYAVVLHNCLVNTA